MKRLLRMLRRTMQKKRARSMLGLFTGITSLFLLVFSLPSAPQQSHPASERPTQRLDVRIVADEADAVLAILARKAAGQGITDADWQRLFSSEGYVRLKKREASMKRDFSDEDFRRFVLSDELAARADALQKMLDQWKKADLAAAAGRALAYLPEGTKIRARVYPVIKPRTNSFVFETSTDPAIFLYLSPQMTSAQFESTVAHELHHVGLTSACLPRYETSAFKARPENVRRVLEWGGAFGEGIAMLAAAGGPDVHPHAGSSEEDRARWDRDVANFDADLGKVQQFFHDVLDGRLITEQEIQKVAFSFFGIQGPWYTVGWKMAVTIEKAYGRQRLIRCMCDTHEFLSTFNEAAARQGENLATWSPSLMDRLKEATPATSRDGIQR